MQRRGRKSPPWPGRCADERPLWDAAGWEMFYLQEGVAGRKNGIDLSVLHSSRQIRKHSHAARDKKGQCSPSYRAHLWLSRGGLGH